MVALVEAAQALERLGTGDRSVEALRLDPQSLVERHPEPAHGGLLVRAQRRLGKRGDLLGELDGARHTRPRRDDLVDEADLARLVRVDDAAGDDQLHRTAHADDARETL